MITWKLDQSITAGTSLRGKIVATFAELVEVFGEPNIGAVSYTHLTLPTTPYV